jgi:hypothetical protein
MADGVVDRDLGWDRIKRETEALSGKAVKVGIQSDGGDVIDRAFFNEYGTAGGASGGGWGGPVPARPFISTAFEENRENLHQMKARLWNGVIDGRIGADQAARLLGEHHQNQVREKITAIDTPPNAPLTVELKGSSNPLIDTGQMRQTVRYEIE